MRELDPSEHHRLCERLCSACHHHHAHDYRDGVCLNGEATPAALAPLQLVRCLCEHRHGKSEWSQPDEHGTSHDEEN